MNASAAKERGVIYYADFQPNESLGQHSEGPLATLMADWIRLYPDDPGSEGHAPAGLVTVMLMRAYLNIVSPRPPGNMHGGQSMRLHRIPDIGARITTDMRCAEKFERKGRRFVRIEAFMRDSEGNAVADANMTMIWAA